MHDQYKLGIHAPWACLTILLLLLCWPAAGAGGQSDPGQTVSAVEDGPSAAQARGLIPGPIERPDFEPLEAYRDHPATAAQAPATQKDEWPVIVAQLPGPVTAPAATRPAPGRGRSIQALRATDAPVIDGHLSESVWERAAVADRFWVSDQDRAPSEPTEARVLFDAQTLYVAFRVFDRQPQRIEAQQVRRDAGLGYDDTVIVEVDANRNYRDISRFYVNALGTQQDAIAGGRASKIDWKGDWQAAVARTDYGWSVEMAIPFRMLSYPNRAQVFGINFVRYHNRTGERSYWADLTPQFKPEEMGRLTGLELPASERRRLTIMPYALVGINAPDKQGRVRDRLGSIGADIRLRPSAETTALLSLNPDFSQIEAQFATVNFSYTEKAVSDQRSFFQEGANFFDAGRSNLYFYSNRIPNFDAGGRYFGRVGNTQFGGFATTAPEGRRDFGARVLQELDATNFASLSAYGTSRGTLDSHVVVGQINGRQPSGLNYSADIATSQSSGAGGDASHLRSVLGWDWDYWYISSSADRYGKGFDSSNGLLPADLPGTRGTSGSAGYYRVYGSGPIYAARADVSLASRDTQNGLLQNKNASVGGYLEYANEMRTGLYWNDGKYRPVTPTRGVFSGTLNDDHYWTATLDFNTRSARAGYGMSRSEGRLGGGDYRFDSAYLWIKPRNDLYFSASSERVESSGAFEQTTLVTKWDVTPTDAIGARLVVVDGDRYSRLTYGRQARKGMDIFAVIDTSPNLRTQFSIKLLFTYP